MRVPSATFGLLAVLPVLAEDARPPSREWRLPAGTSVSTVLFAGEGTPTAVDLSGTGRVFDDPARALHPLGLRGITCVAVLQDGSAAFAGLPNGDVWRWDLTTGERLRASSRHASTVACAAVSPDGRLVATGS